MRAGWLAWTHPSTNAEALAHARSHPRQPQRSVLKPEPASDTALGQGSVPFQRVYRTVRRQVRDQELSSNQIRRRNIKGIENVR